MHSCRAAAGCGSPLRFWPGAVDRRGDACRDRA
jgi:hypothetical protein